MRIKVLYLILIASVTGFSVGCSKAGYSGAGGGSSSGSTAQTVHFSLQPASQTVPLGQSATFTVEASGVGALSYQWTRNGSEIDGATKATYTIAALTPVDNGAVYAVVVKDFNGEATSASASLTASPRAPRSGDLRLLLFQQATVSGLGVKAQASTLPTNGAQLFPGAVGSPLEVGAPRICQSGVEYGCDWDFFVEYLPASQNSLTMLYQGRDYQQFSSDLNCISAANVVINSVDFEPVNNAYGMAWVSTLQGSGFDLRREMVAPSEIAATAAQDGAESRVITAVSFDADGQVNLFSYGWTSDTHTVFETRTVLATLDTIVDRAKALAQAGYIISAFGGNDVSGYLIVGTRVQGDTIPRPLVITTPTATTATTSATQSTYSTPVIRFAAADSTQILISEY